MPKNAQNIIQLLSFHMLYSKVMLKILHARLQDYVNQELPDVQPGFRKVRGTRDQIDLASWWGRKSKDFRVKTINF